MGIGGLILNKYRTFNLLFKILFFGLFIIGGLLWVIGNWTKLDTLIMFVIGILFGLVLGGIFVYHNLDWVNNCLEKLGIIFS